MIVSKEKIWYTYNKESSQMDIYKTILLFALIPISIIIAIIILIKCILQKKESEYKRSLLILKLLGLLFIIYIIFSFFLSVNRLLALRQFNTFTNSKIEIIGWIILPIIPTVILIIIKNKYNKIKAKGASYEQTISSH